MEATAGGTWRVLAGGASGVSAILATETAAPVPGGTPQLPAAPGDTDCGAGVSFLRSAASSGAGVG
ncbi:MAG TPA: hypothetical protein VFA91_12330, partial [Candidatus Polarisedimenticolia bacterium]|nr:hypothetical protein [Candidatus Polarisedimenticolia bacterium]